MSASLTPPPVSAAAKRQKRFAVAFGDRFFLLISFGLAWIAPAFIDLRFFYGMLVWDAFIIAAWAYDYMRLPRPSFIEATRSWRSPAGLHSLNVITVTLHNKSLVGLYVSLTDETPKELVDEIPRLEMVLRPRGENSVSYEIRPMQRGEFFIGSVYLRYQGPLHLAERWASADLGQKILIYPNLEEAKQHSIYMIRSRQMELEKRRERRRGYGREFESLREHQDGDEFRNICWSASARRGKLVTRLFQSERSQTIWLVIDSGRLMRAKIRGLSKLDYAVNASLSLAQIALSSGDRVGLLGYGRAVRHRVPPNRGGLHLRMLIEQLALIREEATEADHMRSARMLLSIQKRRSLIVWITDLAETAMTPEVVEAVGVIASRHLVIFAAIGQPDLAEMVNQQPSSVSQMYLSAAAQEVAHRRELLIARLRQRGVLAAEIDSATAAASIINSYLDVKERNLL